VPSVSSYPHVWILTENTDNMKTEAICNEPGHLNDEKAQPDIIKREAGADQLFFLVWTIFYIIVI